MTTNEAVDLVCDLLERADQEAQRHLAEADLDSVKYLHYTVQQLQELVLDMREQEGVE